MNKIEINTPWEDPQDLLDRKKYADFLVDYLANRGQPFVLNLNASWGMGKTYFLTHWRTSIQDTYPTVYVNAWESDFSEDPLLAVMATIHEQLSEHLPEEEKTIQSFATKLKTGGRFLRGLAPIVTKGLVTKALGEDATQEAGKEISDWLSISNEDVAKIAEKSMGMLLEDHAEKVQSATDFKIALAALVESVTLRELEKPLFLFIDELDRCRPTYAIEMLETVKHLFSVDGVVFVIATDSEQLQHSIRAIYGNDFSGSEYLRRFFDQEYILPEPDYYSYCRYLACNIAYADKLDYAYFQPWNIGCQKRSMPEGWSAKKSLAALLAFYSKQHSLNLRSINQVAVRLEAIVERSTVMWDGAFLILLLILQAKDKELVRWLQYRSNNWGVKNNLDDLNEKLSQTGETVNWFCNRGFKERPIDRGYTAFEICKEYISAIGEFSISADRNKHNYLARHDVPGAYALNQMAMIEVHDRKDFCHLASYFDHVYMAGALS